MSPSSSAQRNQTRPGLHENSEDLDEHWGDPIPIQKEPHNYRLVGMNIGGFSSRNMDKFHFLQHFIQTHEPDAICLCETALLWNKLPEHKHLINWGREC